MQMQDECVLAKILVAPHSEHPVGSPIALSVADEDEYAEFLKKDPSEYAHLVGAKKAAAPAPAAAAPPAAAPSKPAAPAPVVAAPAPTHAAAPVAHAAAGAPLPANVLVLPAARHMMDTMHVSPAAVLEHIASGSGNSRSGGRIVIRKEDVINFLETRGPSASGAAASAAGAAGAKPAAVVSSSAGSAQSSGYTDIPNNNIRKVIAKRLTESKLTVPHAYTTVECNIDALLTLRKELKKDFDINISVNDVVIKAAALALRDVPEANARWDAQSGAPRANPQVDISVAVATPTGLITPIVFGADRRGVGDINSAVKDLATRAKEGKLKPEEFQGGTFTISNLGMFGISEFSAVINPPQACILAVGGGISRIAPPKAVAAEEGAAAPVDLPVETTMTVQLSSDRRVLDDATAARFLQVFRSYINNPKKLIL